MALASRLLPYVRHTEILGRHAVILTNTERHIFLSAPPEAGMCRTSQHSRGFLISTLVEWPLFARPRPKSDRRRMFEWRRRGPRERQRGGEWRRDSTQLNSCNLPSNPNNTTHKNPEPAKCENIAREKCEHWNTHWLWIRPPHSCSSYC